MEPLSAQGERHARPGCNKEECLNHMSNPLFDLFVNGKSVKVIWEKLEKKYDADDVGKKKAVVGK